MSTNPLTVAVIEATEVAEDLRCLWQQRRVLEHRLRYLRLQFEYDFFAVDFDEQDRLADEIAEWRSLVRAFASRRSTKPTERSAADSRRAA